MELTNFVFSGRHELLPRHIITTTADSIIIIDQSNCKNKNCNENFQTPDRNNPPHLANWTAWSAKWTTAYSFLSPLFRHRTTCGPYLGTLNFTRFIMSTNRTICRPHSSPQDIKALSLLSGHQSYTIHQTQNTPDHLLLGRNFPEDPITTKQTVVTLLVPLKCFLPLLPSFTPKKNLGVKLSQEMKFKKIKLKQSINILICDAQAKLWCNTSSAKIPHG